MFRAQQVYPHPHDEVWATEPFRKRRTTPPAAVACHNVSSQYNTMRFSSSFSFETETPSFPVGQTKQKDPRTLNDEFIQTTFRRLRDFLTEKCLVSEMPSSSKLTLRQFETIFLTLMRCIFPNYNRPSGNNWVELDVPMILESLGYPHKVMKSTLQTVSSKVGPIMSIIDFLIEIATAMDCDHQEAIRLLSRGESPAQFDLQIELLAQSTFAKGVTVDSPHIQAAIKDFCVRSKGIGDEDGIRLVHFQAERVGEEMNTF